MSARPRRNIDDRLAVSLARGSSIAAAARLVGVSERTVHRRLADPAFRRLVQDVRGRMVERAASLLSAANAAAVRTLRDLLSDSSATVRLSAAKSIIELGAKLRESHDLEERISRLEEAAKKHEHP